MSGDFSEFYKVIADEAITGIIVIEEDSLACKYINQLAREIIEFAPQTPHEQLKINELFPANQREGFRSFSKEILGLEGLNRDVLMQKSNGIPVVADVGIKKLYLDDLPHTLIMFQDVTIQKKLQREISLKQQEIQSAYTELLEQNKQLKELDVAKDKFIALTTHELRTPISAIYATAEVLKLKFYDTDEQRDEFIDTIFDQAQSILDLVNDILDFAKIQAGKMDFFIEHQDLRESLNLQTTNFQQMASQNKIELIYNEHPEPLMCYFDNIRLGEVLSNIINNAIKFTDEGGKVKILAQDQPDSIEVSVIDTGQGIPPDKIDKVFDEFETIGNIQTHQKGTGLGMPISKKIMESMGGRIFLTSKLGEGTAFTVKIPKNKVLTEEDYNQRPEQVDDLLNTV